MSRKVHPTFGGFVLTLQARATSVHITCVQLHLRETANFVDHLPQICDMLKGAATQPFHSALQRWIIMPIRVLIVDDHSVVRQGLRIFLEMDSEIAIAGEAADGAEAVNLARKLRPDVVLMDLLLPVLDGISATSQIRRELPDTEVIALTSVLENTLVYRAVQAGAIGYLLKDTEAPRLRQAIKSAYAGQVQLSPEAAASLMREIRAPHDPESLTERESDVLKLLAQGMSNKEIAHSLQIGETTVKTHIKNIMQKLNVTSRTQAALQAVRMGLVALPAQKPLL